MKFRKVTAIFGALLILSGVGLSGASADSKKHEDVDSVVISGQKLGPKDGLRVVTESYAVTPGGGSVGAEYGNSPGDVSPQLVWGSSYAFSQEQLYVSYIGYAKAAANIYNNERIVKVCFWWTQDTRTSPTTCASATFSNGTWYASPEVSATFNDSLDTYAPQTQFHIQTYRVDPRL